MQNDIMLTFFSSLLFLQAPTAPSAPTAKEATQEKALHEVIAQKSTETMNISRSTMIIDPKARADDYKKAFDILKQEKSTSKVFFQLADGTQISNVIEMQLLPSNTLILFRYSTPQGIKFHVVEIEDVVGILHK